MIAFLLTCGLTYIWAIFKELHIFFKIRYCLDRLSDFYAAYLTEESYGQNPDNYTQELAQLLKAAPIIQEIKEYPELSYNDPIKKTFEKVVSLHGDIKMLENKNRIDLIRSLSPFRTAKLVLLLPAKMLKKLGISVNNVCSGLISVIIDVFLDYVLRNESVIGFLKDIIFK